MEWESLTHSYSTAQWMKNLGRQRENNFIFIMYLFSDKRSLRNGARTAVKISVPVGDGDNDANNAEEKSSAGGHHVCDCTSSNSNSNSNSGVGSNNDNNNAVDISSAEKGETKIETTSV